MAEKELLPAILQGNCPKCREGKLFTSAIYNLSKLGKMEESCSCCGLTYEREPGFFYGAMFVSYAFSVGVFLVGTLLIYLLFNNPSLNTYIISIISISFILYPINFRYSRILYLYGFGGIKYDSSISKR
ncbi:MAG: DUF983 domain-containing protein [Cyclobacteriaceae bacterium]|nr:DUF983 domain-containing protein [Cyclobacteriaceae bacterium]